MLSQSLLDMLDIAPNDGYISLKLIANYSTQLVPQKSKGRIGFLCCSIVARYIFFVYTLQGHTDYFLEMTFRGIATLRTIRIMRAMRLKPLCFV